MCMNQQSHQEQPQQNEETVHQRQNEEIAEIHETIEELIDLTQDMLDLIEIRKQRMNEFHEIIEEAIELSKQDSKQSPMFYVKRTINDVAKVFKSAWMNVLYVVWLSQVIFVSFFQLIFWTVKELMSESRRPMEVLARIIVAIYVCWYHYKMIERNSIR